MSNAVFLPHTGVINNCLRSRNSTTNARSSGSFYIAFAGFSLPTSGCLLSPVRTLMSHIPFNQVFFKAILNPGPSALTSQSLQL